ncbi:hypothetical protein ACFL6C_02225 [Myxococcota bacterium]
MPSAENLTVVGSLFIKTSLLAAKWAGATRRKALEPIEEKDKEIVFLRDRVEQLGTRGRIQNTWATKTHHFGS